MTESRREARVGTAVVIHNPHLFRLVLTAESAAVFLAHGWLEPIAVSCLRDLTIGACWPEEREASSYYLQYYSTTLHLATRERE